MQSVRLVATPPIPMIVRCHYHESPEVREEGHIGIKAKQQAPSKMAKY